MPDLVTVIIPCFNYATYLPECVESIKLQTYSTWECIIVNDGSTDSTLQVANKLATEDRRIRVVSSVENRGPSAARNLGVRDARGEYIQFLDADDLLQPAKIRAQVEYLERHHSVDIVFGPAGYFLPDSPLSLEPWGAQAAAGISENSNPNSIVAALVKENICMTHALLFRRRVFDAFGGFDERLRTHEDWELWLRCALGGATFAFTSGGQDRALVRRHTANTSRNHVEMWRSAAEVRQRIAPFLPATLSHQNTALLSELRRKIAVELVVSGKIGEGWRLYAKGILGANDKWRALLRLPSVIPGLTKAYRRLRARHRSHQP